MQVARLMGARHVFGTASAPEKLRGIAALGCDVPIDYRNADFVAAPGFYSGDLSWDAYAALLPA